MFTFEVLLCFLMTNLQKGLQREIANFVAAMQSAGGSIPEVSKAAFCKARKKLKVTAFVELSKVALTTFYNSKDVQHWQGYRVLGVDGSTVELPNSKEIQQTYGVFKYRNDGKAICMGRTLLIYDVLNHLTLHGSLANMEDAETTMFHKACSELRFTEKDLLVFDRYYASHLLFFALHQKGVQYCFRMKKNWWKIVESFYNSGTDSHIITLTLPVKDKDQAELMGITETQIKVRLVRIALDGGATEILLTSLTDEETFSKADLKELYGLRWNIEEAYKTFKHKVCVENFSGKSCKAVLQDFYVKLFIMNLTAIAVRPINDALKKAPVKVKYTHQVNIVEALASMKTAVVALIGSKRNIRCSLLKLYARIRAFTEPIRPDRKYKRPKIPKRKYPPNYKHV